MRVTIDLPVFASRDRAFGYASGELEVESLPKPQEAFPWPAAWVEAKPQFFSGEQGLVWGVDKIRKGTLVSMYGIVCETLAEARECAAFLEQVAGLEFNEHGHLPGDGDG